MEFIGFMIKLWANMWTILGGITIDGVKWTSIVVTFIALMIIIFGFLHVNRG